MPKVFPRVPVIMVNYTDMSYRVTRANVDSMFNGEHFTLYGATGSVRRYFYDQSDGQYSPQFDIYGPVTVSHNYAYYGRSNGSYRATELMLEACALMDDSLDFTLYDTDGDNKVDLVYVLFAGPPASDGACVPTSWISNPTGRLIWPHFWTVIEAGMTSKPHVFDGKTVNEYEVSSELDGCASDQTTTVMAGVGLACHEFGHGLGLPDLYTTMDGSHKTCGNWDIMDYGCYNNDVRTPPGYSAYERWFMGWRTPRLVNSPETVTLQAMSTGGTAVLLSPSGTHNLDGVNPSPTDFYLLENRQQNGWDTYIPGAGMLVTHIRFNASDWALNMVNCTPDDMGVDIVEADGLSPQSNQSGYLGKPGDLFPTGSTSFTECTNYPVRDIAMANGVITFRQTGGTSTMDEVSVTPDGTAALYTLTGERVTKDNNLHGVFILVQNGKAIKIIK
jgi:M6 family metalloprotease-like protein